MSRPVEHFDFSAYSDAVKELQGDGVYQLQRLATKMPDQLLVSSLREAMIQTLRLYAGRLSTIRR